MHRRSWTPVEVGGFIIALALVLACCLGVCVLGVIVPSPPVAPATTPSLIVPSRSS